MISLREPALSDLKQATPFHIAQMCTRTQEVDKMLGEIVYSDYRWPDLNLNATPGFGGLIS